MTSSPRNCAVNEHHGLTATVRRRRRRRLCVRQRLCARPRLCRERAGACQRVRSVAGAFAFRRASGLRPAGRSARPSPPSHGPKVAHHVGLSDHASAGGDAHERGGHLRHHVGGGVRPDVGRHVGPFALCRASRPAVDVRTVRASRPPHGWSSRPTGAGQPGERVVLDRDTHAIRSTRAGAIRWQRAGAIR